MSQTVELIRAEVLAHGFSSANYSARINKWIDEATREMWRKAGYRIKEKTKTYETVSGTESYELPTDYASVLYLLNTSVTPDENLVNILSLKDFNELEPESGEPTVYIIEGKNIRLYPKPSGVYKLTLGYTYIAAEVGTSDSGIPLIPEDYIVLIQEYCLYKAYIAEGDVEMGNYHLNIYEKKLIEFVGDMNTDTHDKVEQIEGAWPGGYP